MLAIAGCAAGNRGDNDATGRHDGSADGLQTGDGSMHDGVSDGVSLDVVGSDADAQSGDASGDADSGNGEICGDGLDNNGNTYVDEGCPCLPGETERCFPGNPHVAGIGICTFGTQTCMGMGEFGSWGRCVGATPPGPETCDGIDNDCDGVVDNGCNCMAGTARNCYDGPPATRLQGVCHDGTEMCVAGAGGIGSSWTTSCAGELLPSMEICDGIDNNCDGTVDEGCSCEMGMSRTCYGGPAGTTGVGICHSGMQSCAVSGGMATWGTCAGQQTPQIEVCDGIDNDCNGVIDDGCHCHVGDMRTCYDGGGATRSVGLCHDGTQRCIAGAAGVGSDWGMCGGEVVPSAEICDGLDNNCDGTVDEGCGCTSGMTRGCYDGPAGTSGVGACRDGLQMCSVASGAATWSACAGEVVPTTEICGNGIDDDCNGVVDESCACAVGTSRLCYDGATGTSGVGVCHNGMQTCTLVGTMAAWGLCAAEVVPASSEICGNGLDDNCNGMTDEGCTCGSGTMQACYDGPVGTLGVGICTGGNQTCVVSGGTAAWGACGGETTPATELCDGIDNNCNGTTDEGCVCHAGDVQSCYDGAAGTNGVGLCHGGSQPCVIAAGLASWGACAGELVPGVEICNGTDDNCNGIIDEGCACRSGDAQACYDGAPGTSGVGICHGGTQACVVAGGTASWGSCAGEVMPGTETCDGLDNNCNGTVDEGCGCVAGTSRACYDGGAGTSGVGVCHGGTQTCTGSSGSTAWGTCAGELTPVMEICDGIDNNCNGTVDEGCACVGGAMRPCYGGPSGTAAVGICHQGSQSCIVASGIASWSMCSGEQDPLAEVCDGVDNNCNGVVDEGCLCTPSSSAPCYDGPAGTSGVGVCRAGTDVCNASGSGYSACTGETLPATEVCNGADDNCNGVVDEGCACMSGSTQACYDGPAGTVGVGICHAGSQTCAASGGGTAWGACSGETVPAAEVCGNGIDDNCNGAIDEGCVCAPGSSASCYAGPAGTAGVGICHAGTHTCNPGGTAYGPCMGEQDPQTEICDGLDNNCNAIIDETCTCIGGSIRSCYTGPGSTAGVGACRAGTQTCNVTGGVASWGSCMGEIDPAPAEVCINGIDDNCNGTVDEGCVCAPGTSTSCYTGPTGTRNVGVCRSGTATCNAAGTAYGACTGQVVPGASEVCGNGLDDNCNGAIDEGCVCAPGATASCYGGPAGTAGVGICRLGSHTCNAGGTGYGACGGEVDPQVEVCGDGIDQDCNGSDLPCGPVVTCPAPQSVPAGTTATMTATVSGGTPPLTYNWVVVSGPTPYTLGSSTSTTATLNSTIVGVYSLQFTATDSMGRTGSCTTQVTMAPHGLRIELRWDSLGDMDLHLINPSATSWFTAPNDCYFADRTPEWDVIGFLPDNPGLDIDNTTSLGPENIRIDQPVIGEVYTIGVHYWASNGGPSPENNHVAIYCGDTSTTPVTTLTRAINGVNGGSSTTNDFWRVATVQFTTASTCIVTPLATVISSTAAHAGR